MFAVMECTSCTERAEASWFGDPSRSTVVRTFLPTLCPRRATRSEKGDRGAVL